MSELNILRVKVKAQAYELERLRGELKAADEHHERICNIYRREIRELMAGCETCHIVKTWSDSDYDEDWRYRCSECGCPIPVDERDPETGDVISAANYCPSCGRRVIG